MPQNISITNFSIAPLEKDRELDHYDRLPELVGSVTNELCSSQGGCFLVTGYRGVGKTSFVNKVIKTSKNKTEDKAVIIPVRLSLARGYSTDKLLRRLIRELFYAINKSGVYDSLDDDTRQKLNTAFLRTSRQIKTALAQGLKEAISKTDTTATRYSSENKLEAGIGAEKIVGLLGSFSAKREKEFSESKTRSKETSSELGMEIEFLEYDDEVAENDLSELINLLQNKKVEVGQNSRIATFREFRKPLWLWRLVNKLFSGIDSFQSISKTENTPVVKSIKLLFVLDEIDKMSTGEAEEIFRSLKNLFLKGNIFFFLITGKAFYYDWLRKRTSEDDVFFSLFTRIIHIPLFSDEEFDAVAKNIADGFPNDLLAHLKYKAKGTPREFLRELSRFVDWSTEPPSIAIKQHSERLLQISERLYPYIQNQYEVMEKDERIDVGIRDHLRRSLHNWLEWMTILVTFTKPAVLQPTTEGEKESERALFSARTRDTFNALFEALLKGGIIKDTELKTSDESIYTFTDQLLENLEEIDSSISGQIPDIKANQAKMYNDLLLKYNQLLDDNQFDAAKKLLQEIRKLESEGINDSEKLQKLENEARARELVNNGDQLFKEGLFESALGAYQIASHTSSDSSEIKSRLVKTKFALAFDQAGNAREYDDYVMARNVLMEAIDISHEFFETDIAQMKKDAKKRVDLFGRILYLHDSISRQLKEGEITDVKQGFLELTSLAPEIKSLSRIENQIMGLERDTNTLTEAKQAFIEQRYLDAQRLLSQILVSNNKYILEQAEDLSNRIAAQEKKLNNQEAHLKK